MNFDLNKTATKLSIYFRENRNLMHFFLNGKEVYPEKVSSCSFQVKEISPIDGFNFEATALNLRVQIDSVESPYKASCYVKVGTEVISENEKPEERILEIQKDRIYLRNE